MLFSPSIYAELESIFFLAPANAGHLIDKHIEVFLWKTTSNNGLIEVTYYHEIIKYRNSNSGSSVIW